MDLHLTSLAIGAAAGAAIGGLAGFGLARVTRYRAIDTPDSWRYAMSVRAAAERERLACFAELDIAKRRVRSLEGELARHRTGARTDDLAEWSMPGPSS